MITVQVLKLVQSVSISVKPIEKCMTSGCYGKLTIHCEPGFAEKTEKCSVTIDFKPVGFILLF